MSTNELSNSVETGRLEWAQQHFEDRCEKEQDNVFYCASWNYCGAICEEQCKACEKAENMPENLESASEAIDRFIAENGNNTRDALNVALTRLQLLELKVQYLMNANDEYPDTQSAQQHFEDRCEKEFDFNPGDWVVCKLSFGIRIIQVEFSGHFDDVYLRIASDVDFETIQKPF